MKTNLTGKQLKFSIEYVKCLNATEAARRAGYAGNDVTLASVGYENLRKPQIRQFINKQFEPNVMSAHEVLYQLTMIARGDIDDVLDHYGNVDLDKARARGKTGLIKMSEVRTITSESNDIVESKVVLHDKMAALQTLAKYHDLTNTIKVEDWRSEIIALLKEGKVSPEQVVEDLGYEIAQELFITAGVSSDSG